MVNMNKLELNLFEKSTVFIIKYTAVLPFLIYWIIKKVPWLKVLKFIGYGILGIIILIAILKNFNVVIVALLVYGVVRLCIKN